MQVIQDWAKSSHSTVTNCVEVRRHTQGVDVRDTKDQLMGPELNFSNKAWAEFLLELPQMMA